MQWNIEIKIQSVFLFTFTDETPRTIIFFWLLHLLYYIYYYYLAIFSLRQYNCLSQLMKYEGYPLYVILLNVQRCVYMYNIICDSSWWAEGSLKAPGGPWGSLTRRTLLMFRKLERVTLFEAHRPPSALLSGYDDVIIIADYLDIDCVRKMCGRT